MNKDTNKLFQGILQYTSEQFEQIEKKTGVIYLVRKSDQTNEGDAEVWFGSRRYGTTNVSELLLRNVGTKDTTDVLDEVPTNVFLKYVAQFLTEEQQEQVRKNINAVKNVEGKQLSTEDFTTTLKSKLDSLENYDDTEIRETLNEISDNVGTSFNELNNNLESTFDAINSDMETLRNSKQDKINDLDAIREGAALGATALQSYTEQYKGTVTGVKINGTTKNPSNGVVDLGSVITSHQDISGKQDTLVSGTNIKTVNGESILGEGNLVVESGYVDANVQAISIDDNALDEIKTEVYLKYVSQFLTEEQKAQVRSNIGAVKDVVGKQLSTEDFTTVLKNKLEGLSNYDDAELSNAISSLQTQFNTLVEGNPSEAINSFNEIITFLEGVEDKESLSSIIASIETQISNKQDILTSGTNIKTINGEDILGEGDLIIDTGYVDASVTTRDTAETLDEINVNKCIKYVAQYLTEEEKEQACVNINAMKYGNISCGTF